MKNCSIFFRICANGNVAENAPAAAADDPDDRWANQYREREKNNMYKWVGARHGGELLTVYERDGEEGVLRFAQEKMESMLYNEGAQSQLIKFADYVRWRKSVNIALGITDESSDELNESHSRFSEHEAQWRMNKRGMDGETLVHLLLNRNELVCHEIARILINRYPGMARDIYLGDELFGQSCLHLAIVHDDYDTAKTLLEYGASVNARANGDFFLPEGFEPGYNNNRNMTYEGYAYYGEYPLAFAACFENKDIYDLLIQYGADPDKQDTFGNTILHMCVIHNKNSMYSYSARHWHRPAHSLENFAGQTPLTLASKLGRKQIFDEMLELMKVEFWRFSDMTCSAYPLDALDTIRSDGSTNYDSALMTVLAGDTTEHLEMINSEVIQRLLADKWDAYGRRKLFERLALLVVQLVALCVAVYLRPPNIAQLSLFQPVLADWVRAGAELVAILCSCWFVFIQQIEELRCQGMRAYLWNLSTVPAKVVYMVANVCLLACVPLRIAGLIRIEDALLPFVIPGSWAYVLFFARTTKLIGPFVQMIYSMVAGDLFRFVLISTIFMVPFTETMFFLGKDISAKQNLNDSDIDYCMLSYNSTNYDSFFNTFLTLFRICMNAIFYEELACSNYEQLMKTLFVLFIFLMFIMMITLLIAMINNTYSELIEEAELTWRQQQGQVVMVLERGINAEQLAACQLEYSVRMNMPGREARGLMVIKQTTKTRAHQRKQALANWKMVGRKVLTMAKELGTQSAQYLLHSHDRLVADDTVSGGTAVPRTAYSMTRPYSMFDGGNTALVNRPLSNMGDTMEGGAMNAKQSHRCESVDQQKREKEHEIGQTSPSGLRRPSMPNIQQQPRLSIPNLDAHHRHLLLFTDQSKLRNVVTHATVNNMKLRRAEHEEAQRQKKQILHAGVTHNRKMPGFNNLPGMVEVARRRLLTSASGTPSQKGKRPSTAGETLRMVHLSVPQEKQTAKFHKMISSPSSDKMIVRGIDLVPSIVPNMPATPPRTNDCRPLGFGLQQKSHSVIAIELSNEQKEQLNDYETTVKKSVETPVEHQLDPNSVLISDTVIPMESDDYGQHFEEQNDQRNGPDQTSLNSSRTPPINRARRRVRSDLFRAKNSPPINSINSNK